MQGSVHWSKIKIFPSVASLMAPGTDILRIHRSKKLHCSQVGRIHHGLKLNPFLTNLAPVQRVPSSSTIGRLIQIYLKKINEIVNLMNFPANESVSINFRFEFNNLFGEILNWCGPDPTPGSPNLASGCYGLRPTLRAQRCYALNVFFSWVKPLPPKKNHAKNWAGNMTLSQ